MSGRGGCEYPYPATLVLVALTGSYLDSAVHVRSPRRGWVCPGGVSTHPLLLLFLLLSQVHILIVLYTFGALAIVCDDYFVASLEYICEG